MDTHDFARFLGQLACLTPRQRTQVRHALEEGEHCGAATSAAIGILASLLPGPRACPNCQAPAELLHPWGRSHGLARMRCQACGKTSNALTGTPLAHLRHREQWLRYAQALIEGVSVREAAQRCGVATNTAFRWRHRFLAGACSHRAAHEGGIVEADETFFRQSCKGQRHLWRRARQRGGPGAYGERVAVLVVRDRSGHTADFRLEQVDASHVTAVLRPLVDQDAVLCTDGAQVYKTVARALGLTHRAINLQRRIHVVNGAFHIQNVNAYDSRLKAWMRRFHGVATRYLENYLGWRRMLERYLQSISPGACLQEALGRVPAQQVMAT